MRGKYQTVLIKTGLAGNEGEDREGGGGRGNEDSFEGSSFSKLTNQHLPEFLH